MVRAENRYQRWTSRILGQLHGSRSRAGREMAAIAICSRGEETGKPAVEPRVATAATQTPKSNATKEGKAAGAAEGSLPIPR